MSGWFCYLVVWAVICLFQVIDWGGVGESRGCLKEVRQEVWWKRFWELKDGREEVLFFYFGEMARMIS